MAEALAQGFIAKKKVDAKSIWATDISQERKQVFQDFGANASDSSSDASFQLLTRPALLAHFVPRPKPQCHRRLQVVKNADVIFISVKPQYVSMVIKEFKQHLTEKHIIISIAAGIPLKVLQVLFHQPFPQMMLSRHDYAAA